MKNRKQKLKCSNGLRLSSVERRTALKRSILAAGLILLLFLSTFLPVQKMAAHKVRHVRHIPSMQPASSSMSDILTLRRVDILDAAASLKISKLHCLFSEYHTGLSVQEEKRLSHLIYQESVRHQYDPELIMAVILAESSFHNWSRSKKGAIGLMQILPKTGMEMAESNDLPFYSPRSLFDPHLNVKFGIQYLNNLHHRFGDLERALTAYNYGPTRVSQWLSQDRPLPTRYTRKVLAHYQTFMDEETD